MTRDIEHRQAEITALHAEIFGAPTANGNGQRRRGEDWAAKLDGAPEGQRRAVALEIAGHYLGHGHSPVEVENILLAYCARCTPTPFPEREAREIVRDLARRDRLKARAASVATAPQQADDGPMLVCLGDIAPEPVVWSWPNRIARGKLTLVTGEVGTGKTQVTLDIGARTHTDSRGQTAARPRKGPC